MFHGRGLGFAHIRTGRRHLRLDAVEHRSDHQVAVQADGTDGIVVAGHRIIDVVGIAIAVDDGDHGDAELLGLGHGDGLLEGVDDEQHVGQAAHFLDAAQGTVQLVALAGEVEQFLLGQAYALLDQLFIQLAQALDRVGDGLPVGHHAAEPAVVDVVLAAALGGFGDLVTRLPLGADKQHPPSRGNGIAHRRHGAVQKGHRLLQVDDVDFFADPEQIGGHLGVPAPRVVPEVHARFQKLAYGK